MSDWMERELKRQLAPVSAPDSLWDRVERARREKRVAAGQAGWILWPAVAAIMLFASGDLAWQMDRARPPIYTSAGTQLAELPLAIPVNLSCGRPGGLRLTCAEGSAMAAVA